MLTVVDAEGRSFQSAAREAIPLPASPESGHGNRRFWGDCAPIHRLRPIANAYSFPDALTGAAAAGTVKGPVLLVSATGALNAATAAELTRLAPVKIIVLGVTGVISDAVQSSLTPYAVGE